MLGGLLEETARCAEAGVGEGDVESAVLLERPLDERLLLVPFGHVAGDRDRALVTPELGGQLAQAIGRARGQHEPVAGGRGLSRGGGSDPARGAGDQEYGITHDWPALVILTPIMSAP